MRYVFYTSLVSSKTSFWDPVAQTQSLIVYVTLPRFLSSVVLCQFLKLSLLLYPDTWTLLPLSFCLKTSPILTCLC